MRITGVWPPVVPDLHPGKITLHNNHCLHTYTYMDTCDTVRHIDRDVPALYKHLTANNLPRATREVVAQEGGKYMNPKWEVINTITGCLSLICGITA